MITNYKVKYPLKNLLITPFWKAKIMLNGMKYYERYMALRETFILEQYRFLTEDIKPNTIAIDAGGFIGDSAIYLARVPNIEKVIVFEPDWETWMVLTDNILENPNDVKIIPLQEKVKPSDICFDKRPIILKIDIEGAEADLLRRSDLTSVYKISMEYHDNLDEVMQILKLKHFKVEVRPSKLYRKGDFGIINAWK